MSRNRFVGNEISLLSDSIKEITYQAISKTRTGIDCYLTNDFSKVIDIERLSLKLRDIKRNGLKLRLISDIRMKDSPLYRGLVNCFDIRHIDQNACNIILIDGTEFMTFLTNGKNKTRLLRISDKSFVSAQQFLFD